MSSDKIIFQSVTVADPNSTHNGKVVDIFISKGTIEKVTKAAGNTAKGYKVIDAKGCIVSPGFVDLRANFRDPGFEIKEDIRSGCAVAASGGFTGVAVLPDTNPVIQTKSEVEYLINKAKPYTTSIYPLGALTQNLEGDEITEMYDMQAAGAVAFSNANKSIRNSSVMERALTYAKGFDGVVFSHPEDSNVTEGRQINESEVSVRLGMKGFPAYAEQIVVQRDIEILRYTGGKLHFNHISTEGAVDLIRKAKKEGLNVTADVSIYHVVYTDEATTGYDTNYKLLPPLRGKKDVKALIKGLKDGTIDAIISDHHPEDVEHKEVEFNFSAFGANALQTLLPLAIANLEKELGWDALVTKLAVNPRKIIGLQEVSLKEGESAELTVFNPKMEWTLDKTTNKSKSKNNPMWGKTLKGKVVAVANKGLVDVF